MTLPLSTAYPGRELGHFVEHGMDLRHDFFAIYDDGLPVRGAQGQVQDRALFRDVHLLAADPGIKTSLQTGLLRQLQ